MNIREYYVRMAQLYLNESILYVAAFIGILAVTHAALPGYRIFLIAAAAILLAAIFWFSGRAVFYQHRSSLLPNSAPNLSIEEELLYMPIPDERVVCAWFHPSGIEWFRLARIHHKNGEAVFAMHGRNGEELLHCHFSQLHGIAAFFIGHKSETYSIHHCERFCAESGKVEFAVMKKKGRIVVEKNRKLLLTAKTGFMPVSWQKVFPANTPVFHFSSHDDTSDLLIAAFLVAWKWKLNKPGPFH